MWIWWALSLLILIGSAAFALYIYYGNYKSTPAKKDFFVVSRKSPLPKFFAISKQQVIASLRLKLQAVENNSALYFNELKKLQHRIQAIEKNNSTSTVNKLSAFDEDWEEMYYEANDKKENLENELDSITQALEKATYNLHKAENKEKQLIEKQSELQSQLNQAQTLQNKIGDLQRELEGAAERETDLQVQLDAHKDLINDFELLQQQYAQLQSEASEIQNRMIESKNREVLSKQKINRLTKLESSLEVSEYEKIEIRKSIEEIIIENEALAAKLQDLQEKLGSEKYA